MVRTAHQRARSGGRAGGAHARAVPIRADDRQRDRSGAGGAHGTGPARHGRPAAALSPLAGSAPAGANTSRMAPSARQIVRIVLTVVCVAISLYLLYLLRKPISWILIATFLAVALSPPVNVLSRHMRRGFAITITFLGLLAIPLALIALIVPPLITEANDFADNVPGYARDVTEYVRENDRLRDINEDYDITSKLEEEAGKLPDRLGGAAGTLRDVGFGIVNSLIALIAGVATYIVLTVLGVPFSGPLALIAGLFSLIPLVGATIAAVLIGLVTVFDDFPTTTIIWTIWAIAYQQFENHVIQPQVQKRTVNVQPFITIVAVLFGATLLGVLGALVAIPIAASIQILLREYVDLRTMSVKTPPPEPPPPPPSKPPPPPPSAPPDPAPA